MVASPAGTGLTGGLAGPAGAMGPIASSVAGGTGRAAPASSVGIPGLGIPGPGPAWPKLARPAGAVQAARSSSGELQAAGLPVLRRLGQCPGDHLVHLGRQIGPQLACGRRRRGHLRPHHGQVLVALEGRPAGQHLERRAGQGVQVGPAVDRTALDLLGRHVVDRAEELAGAGQADRRDRQLAQPEVGQVHVIGRAAGGDGAEQHVGGLDVPVDQTPRVGGIECRRDLGDDVHDPGGPQRPLPVDQRPHVPPGDVAHRDEQDALGLARLEHRDDVRVIDCGTRTRLPDEPLPEGCVPGQFGCEYLQRDLAVKPHVSGPVHDRHAAASDQLLDLIAGNPCSGGKVADRRPILAAH